MNKNNISIAFCNRPSYNNPLGGDAIQMLKTKECLETLFGCYINVITSPEQITMDYDIVHVFNFVTYDITWGFISKAHQLKIPIVSSCIYWDYSYSVVPFHYFFFKYPFHVHENTVSFYRFIYKSMALLFSRPVGMSRTFRKHIRKFIEYSNYILPNSIEEGSLLLQFANRQDAINKIRVVYNGVEFNKANILSEKDFFDKYKIPHNYILQVGRIEYLKNQMNLLYALRNEISIPIVFIGQINDTKYANRLYELAERRGNVFFIDRVSHELMPSFYYYARLHVLLSFRESPGLANMEAQAMGCPIVISTSKFLPQHTYFPHTPYSVNPFDVAGIRKIILRAYNERTTVEFDESIFSWRNVAKQTFDVYNEILKNQF